MVTNEPKDVKLTVLVAKGDLEKLREMAKAEDVSTAHIVRRLLREAYGERFGGTKRRK